MPGPYRKGSVLDQKTKFFDHIMTWPFVIGVREREAGVEMDKKRWHTTTQQRAWEDGWNLMDELITCREELAECKIDTGWGV